MTSGIEPIAAAWIRPERRTPRSGRRSDAVAEVRVSCVAGVHEVEIFARDLEHGRRIDVVGQVTSARDRHVPCAGVPVAIVSGRGGAVVAKTHTNAFGEFVFEPQPAGPLGLRVGAGAGAPVVLLWEGDR
jgi:hypothetical protein